MRAVTFKISRRPTTTKLIFVGVGVGMLMLLALTAAAAASDTSPTSSAGEGKVTQGGKSQSQTATQQRMSGAGALSTIASLVPNLITNLGPLVLLLGVGALMMPSLGLSAMGLLRESRRSGPNDQLLANMQLPASFAPYARPLQGTPQDIYYFTKRSFPGLMSSLSSGALLRGLQELGERVARAIDNADRRYT